MRNTSSEPLALPPPSLSESPPQDVSSRVVARATVKGRRVRTVGSGFGSGVFGVRQVSGPPPGVNPSHTEAFRRVASTARPETQLTSGAHRRVPAERGVAAVVVVP